jgi:hypothetical protein
VARETGSMTRSRLLSEALPTMWSIGALHPMGLLARVVSRLHKKLPAEAPKVGPSARKEVDGIIGLMPLMGHETLVGRGKRHSNNTPFFPDNEQGKEPSQAYRQSLPHHADATYVNLGTLWVSPSWSRSACDQWPPGGGASVVIRGWESQPHGEGRQLETMLAIMQTKPE